MNDKIDNIQITMDGFSEILSEIMIEIRSLKKEDNGESALTTDLLNKIVQTIDESKKGVTGEELKAYTAAMIGTMRQLQDEANNSFSEFLNAKIAQLETVVKQPSIVKNQYTIDFKSSKTVIAIIFLSLGLFCSLFGNYNQYQENDRLTDNDLKYRFVKMKNGILPNEITRLENFFYYSDSAYIVSNIRKSVIDYEHRVQEQARKQEQKKQNEENIKRLDSEIQELK
ncbi:hypothetical protein IR148_11640 [Dysgonomonas mossii]|uniref:Uncharacterized protein n=1 Tax=Dysgonomonas mossii TaxID=163665 RepID=A0A4Y9ILH2_9BACT|nr:hypothetical protein [Dysgonomonas mossii]MBF0761697.1 hypothetical protein [Dysgonomonas mossii]TFU89333.1 hypothetical protein E4T88_11635 [Dysgonomonas mossii]